MIMFLGRAMIPIAANEILNMAPKDENAPI